MKKVIALVLALSLVIGGAVLFTSCSKDNAEDTTTTTAAPVETTLADETTTLADETTTLADETTTLADETTTLADETTTLAAEESTSEEESTEAAKAPQTKEEIVAYFNTAINNAKSNSKSIKSVKMEHAVAGEIEGLPKALDSLGQSLIKDNMGEDDSKKNVTWTSAADKNAFFPVETETWASKLTAADVKSATCTESNGVYTIKITTVADGRSTSHAHGKGHAPKAFNVVLPGIIDGYIPGMVKSMFSVGTVATAYPSSNVTVTVDAATGNVKTAEYMMYWTLYIPLGDTDVVLPFSTNNQYIINW